MNTTTRETEDNVEYRMYEKGGQSGKQCMTVCDKTKIKVGSGQCQNDCVYFLEHDYELQEVTCRKVW